MNCNCKSTVEAQLLERFKAAEPNASEHRVSLHGYGLAIVNNTLELRGCMEVKASAKHSTKTGTTRVKKQTQIMGFSYCPFCGTHATGSQP